MEKSKLILDELTNINRNVEMYDNNDDILCGSSKNMICSKLLMRQMKYHQSVRSLEDVILELTSKNRKYEDVFNKLMKSISEEMISPEIIITNFGQDIEKIKELKYKFYDVNKNKITIIIFLEKVDRKAENKIYEKYGKLLDKYPDKTINLRIMRLWGRTPEDLIDEGYKRW